MTTANRPQLMIAITILFGLSSLFSIALVSKATQFHHINSLYITHVSELLDELISYPKIPLNTETVTKKLEDVSTLPVDCFALMNGFDRFLINMIGQVLLCHYVRRIYF